MADDDEEQELSQEERDEIDALLERGPALEDGLRAIGLYVDQFHIVQIPSTGGPRFALMGEMMLGDVAFTKRIQNPEQDKIDKQFSELTFGFGTDDFLNMRERIKKNLADGKSIFHRDDEANE